ncbi:hypothetical protein L210DRAFT_805392, partial [Boletus edulis BED1]
VVRLNGLEQNIILLTLIQCTFSITFSDRTKMVSHHQFALTPAYAFTDYQSQG